MFASVFNRCAVDVGTAAGCGGAGVGYLLCVGGADANGADGHTQAVGRDLRHLGVQALAHFGATVVDDDTAVLVHTNQGAALVEHGGRERNAKLQRADGQTTFARAALGVEGVGRNAARAIVGHRFQLVQHTVAHPVFDHLAVGRGHRQRVAAHRRVAVQIDAAHIQGVERQVFGHAFDHRLDREHALRPAKTAKSRGRLCVGAAPVAHHVQVRQVINVVDVQYGAVVHGARKINAVTAARGHRDLQTEDAATFVKTGFVVEAKVVSLACDHHVVITVGAQFHRLAKFVCGQRSALAEDAGVAFLAAKTTAHAAANHFDVTGAQVECCCGLALVAVRVLGGDKKRHLPIFTWHGVGNLPFQVKLFLLAAVGATADAMGRVGDGPRCVTARQALHGQHEGARLHGLFDGHDGGQFLDQHLGFFGHFPRVEHFTRHHHSHRLPKELDLAGGQKRVVVDDRAAVVFTRDVTRGEDRHHTVLGEQRGTVNAFADELTVRHWRGDERCVQRAPQLGHVVGVDGLAADVQSR